MTFIKGFLLGGAVVFVIYHWGLQPILRKWRDDAEAKAKDTFNKS